MAKDPIKNLRVVQADFIASVQNFGEVPAGLPEIAVCGRSNVGKSSLVNALAGRNHLARTSKTPGRTQQIVLFDLKLSSGESLRLCDLPGFGHAKVSKALLHSFSPMIQAYLTDSKDLRAVVILQDCRRDRDEDAIGFAEWLRDLGRHVEIVATKMDELPKTQRTLVLMRLQKDFGLKRLPIGISVRENLGVTDLLHQVRRLLKAPKPQP